jgi:hypothetical protein
LTISYVTQAGPTEFLEAIPEILVKEKVEKPQDVERPRLRLERHAAVFQSVSAMKREVAAPPGSARARLKLTEAPTPPPRPLRRIGTPRLDLVQSFTQPG